MREATGLTCSIGITPNKLLSKLASELDKPDGLTLLGHDDIPARIWPLAARKVNGIGPKAAREARGPRHRTRSATSPRPIRRSCSSTSARSYGAWLHEAAHGRDDRPVVTYERAEVDQPRDHLRARPARGARSRACSARSSPSCASELAGDLARKGYASKTIGIKLRFDDFKIVDPRPDAAGAHDGRRAPSGAPPANA